jgi:polyphosphate kinase 2
MKQKKEKKAGKIEPEKKLNPKVVQIKDGAKKTEAKVKSADPVLQKEKKKKTGKKVDEATKPISDVVRKDAPKIQSTDPEKQIQRIQKHLKKRDKEEILKGSLKSHHDAEELKPFQVELLKLQRHLENTNKKMVILFDGRDASGKGGTIRRITRYLNEKRYRVVALGKPSEHQKSELHIKRYIEHFPRAGEIVLFDRSWYNRALVEPVMGFCSADQYKRFMKKVITYEQNFLMDAGRTILIKLYFSVSKGEQKRRFNRRKNDPLRQWKLSEVDLQAQALWDEFTEKKFQLLKKTHTKKSPWWVIRSDNKHLARRETMKLILDLVPYKGRSRDLDMTPDPSIVIPGDRELRRMKKQRKKYGKLVE